MASISTDAAGNRRILFMAKDGSRKAIRLGSMAMKQVEGFKSKVETILASKFAAVPLDAVSACWLRDIADDLHAKLAAVGLVAPRRLAAAADIDLASWLAHYRGHRADVARGTSTNYGIVADRLLAFFPSDRRLRAFAEGDADRWLVWLKQKYAGPTVSKSIKVARQFWAQAIRDKLATINPFSHLRGFRRR